MQTQLIGFGSPLVDYLARENDTFITQNNLIKGGMTLVNAEQISSLVDKVKNPQRAPGGSAANTIVGLARLGIHTAFCGMTGTDTAKSFLEDTYRDLSINTHFLTSPHGSPTGRVLSIITPDSERTFATYLGAALDISADDLTDELFSGQPDVYIEGYLIANTPLFRRICEKSAEHGCRVSIDLASFNVVEDNRDLLLEVLQRYAGIIFANEEEAAALTGIQSDEAVHKLAELAEIAVMKIGKRGSLIARAKDVERVEIQTVEAVDTTGAGDLYAAGFMAGLLKKKSLTDCARMGSITSRYVVQQYGAFIPTEKWQNISSEINAL
jgi:sugar/nucleoside kinase (ribokinase family)